MALEVLNKIREAEAEALRLTQEAQQDAREMISAAERNCRDREREADQAGAALKQELIDKKRHEVKAQIGAAREKLTESRKKQLEAARALLPQAADYIISQVLNDGHR